jgi:small-conductance mechanosensitive channel
MNAVNHAVQLVGPNGALRIFGIELVGVNAENGKKLLFSLVFLVLLFAISGALGWALKKAVRGRDSLRVTFWSRQAVHLATAVILLVGLVSIWFNDPTRLTTALGLVTAGVAFALQRVITAFAGYFVILRGNTFNVGDRIVMGGVRGDVIALGFMQTTVMEMGQPAPVQNADPAMWVRGRQYTGRIVTITNDKIFDEPVYNYSRDFPFLWEEIAIPVPYDADGRRAERILLDAAQEHTLKVNELGEEAIKELERRYFVRRSDLGPKVYYRLTDNWLEMSLRFLTRDSGIREMKDAMSRKIIADFRAAGIGIASGTYDIVGLPPVHVVVDNPKPGARSEEPREHDANGRG